MRTKHIRTMVIKRDNKRSEAQSMLGLTGVLLCMPGARDRSTLFW